MSAVQAALDDVLGPGRLAGVDETVIEYIVGVLEDDGFEWGDSADNAVEAVGALLIESGAVKSDGEVLEVCSALHSRLGSKGKVAEEKILKGPIKIGGLTIEESGVIQKPSGAITEMKESMSVATAADELKLERRRKKEEKVSMQAYETHVANMEKVHASSEPVIIRSDVGSGGSRDIHLENFSLSNGGAELIENASLTLAYGRRYGLIGRNGTGKSTFLRAFAGKEIDGIPRNIQVLHVEQEVAGDDMSARDCVLACDAERTALLAQEKELLEGSGKDDGTAAARLKAIYDRLEQIDAAGAEARAAMILSGLSFDADMQSQPTRSFSGGWRMRIALARALFVSPDVLLLDEPTNHLDLHAVLWLQDYLIKWPKTIIVVSHAREFLNTVVTDIVHLQSKTFTVYKGDYNTFEGTRAERVRNAQKAAESASIRRAEVQAFIDKFRFNAKRAALVQSRIKALERMQEVKVMEEDPEYVFHFPEPDQLAAPLLGFNDVNFSYPGSSRVIFRDVNFGIDMESRLAIVGPNGVGKSTLLGLINGTLQPSSGFIQRSPKLRMATFTQHHVDSLDLSQSALQHMVSSFPGVLDQELRSHLGSFGISGNLALQQMFTLSGGRAADTPRSTLSPFPFLFLPRWQKSRVAFAKLTWTKPHILLLDEPSNHLDLDAVDALAEGLATYKGGVLLVSHDQHLISAVVDELWAVSPDGCIKPFHGTFEDYKTLLKNGQV